MQCKTYRTQSGLLPIDESMRIPMVISLKQKSRQFTSKLIGQYFLLYLEEVAGLPPQSKMAVGQAYHHWL